MKLRTFLDEIMPHEKANLSQYSYDVVIGLSDDSNGDLWPIEEIEWDHAGGKIIIRMGYLDDQS